MDAIDTLHDYISALWAGAVDTPFPPIPRSTRGDGTVYVEWRRGSYWLICEERGEEYWRREAKDMDDAAFQLMSIVVGEVVRDRELVSREKADRQSTGLRRVFALELDVPGDRIDERNQGELWRANSSQLCPGVDAQPVVEGRDRRRAISRSVHIDLTPGSQGLSALTRRE